MNLSVLLLEYFTDIIVDFIVLLPGVTRLFVRLTRDYIYNVIAMENNWKRFLEIAINVIQFEDLIWELNIGEQWLAFQNSILRSLGIESHSEILVLTSDVCLTLEWSLLNFFAT
jgi:hypothetical protein